MLMTSILLSSWILLAAPSAAPFSPPQVKKETKIQDDLEFAVDLARYRYFDLANEFVNQVMKGGQLSDEEKDTLLLTKGRILKLASEYATNEEERLGFYKEAIKELKNFVQYNTDYDQYDEVRMDLAEVYSNFGRFLYQKMQREEDPKQLDALRTQAEEAFKEGIRLYNEIETKLKEAADALRAEGEDEQADEATAMARKALYSKGITYYAWATIYKKDDFNRTDYLNRCIEALDDYIWDAPEDDFYALWAYLYQAMAYTEKGNFEDAIDLVKQVNDPQSGIDLDQATRLAPEYARLITDLSETAYYQAARIYNRTGKYEEADKAVKRMISEFASRKLELGEKGFMARLEQARALLKMNDPSKTDEAAEICKDVADKNPKNNVGWEAKRILKDIIEKTTSSTVTAIALSPDVLFSAADGYRSEQKYQAAIRAYLKVIRACKTKQQQQEFVPKTWNAIGSCYSLLKPEKRWLEASIAYEMGFQAAKGGPDQEMSKRNAMNWYSALMRRAKETRDPFDNKRMRAARDLLVQTGLGSEDLVFLIALDKFNRAMSATGAEKATGMKDAIEDFKQVSRDSSMYERSLVYQARCHFEMGKFEDALKAFKEFKKTLAGLPIAGTKRQRQNRIIAQAEGAYWLSQTLIELKKYKEAFEALKGFESEYSTQKDFFPAVMYNRLRAKLGLQEFDEAEKLYKQMKTAYPDSARTATAAYFIGLAYIDKAQSVRGDTAKPAPKEYIQYLQKGTEFMRRYCEASGYDSFKNLKSVCEWYKELGDLGLKGAYETARDQYKTLLKVFGKDPNYKTDIQTDIYRGYAEVLNKLHDFQTAKPIWQRLVNANTKNVGILREAAFCYGGWLEVKGNEFIEIPGTGDYAPPLDKKRDKKKLVLNNAYSIWNYLLTGITQRARGTPEWYEAKFYTAYTLYKAGERDPTYYQWSLKIISNLRVLHPDMGGPEYKRMFRYVESAVQRKR